ncbi:gp45.1 [Escherichia phage N15]|uniref:Gp45.1 n=1 Tax=Escherichia phage N15 TaxID=1604876 RepID=O64353_BPN15|nr:gp45.1 [Escherichia phage N15]AAC19084.1 gp45.1 [Escherichia phage N15]
MITTRKCMPAAAVSQETK